MIVWLSTGRDKRTQCIVSCNQMVWRTMRPYTDNSRKLSTLLPICFPCKAFYWHRDRYLLDLLSLKCNCADVNMCSVCSWFVRYCQLMTFSLCSINLQLSWQLTRKYIFFSFGQVGSQSASQSTSYRKISFYCSGQLCFWNQFGASVKHTWMQ